MADVAKAAAFVQQHGTPFQRARARALLDGAPAPDEALAEVVAAQRPDGGFAPFWAPEASSVDATCFRLAQLDDLGAGAPRDVVSGGLGFLGARQRDDGTWEEDASLASVAPPWARPGDEAARIYLTANCALTLLRASRSEAVRRAAASLVVHVGSDGRLPTSLQGNWLAAAVLEGVGEHEAATRILGYLDQRLDELGAGELAWLARALGRRAALARRATGRLALLQRDDGSWANEDGPAFDVEATLAAIRALLDAP